MMRRKTNRGHSLEVLPDIHPFEADDISALTTANGAVRVTISFASSPKLTETLLPLFFFLGVQSYD